MVENWKELEQEEGVRLSFELGSKQFRVNGESFEKEYEDYSAAKAIMTKLVNEKLGIKPEKGKEPVPVFIMEYNNVVLEGKATSIQTTRYGGSKYVRVTTLKNGQRSSKQFYSTDVYADNESNRAIANQIIATQAKVDELRSSVNSLKESLQKFDCSVLEVL